MRPHQNTTAAAVTKEQDSQQQDKKNTEDVRHERLQTSYDIANETTREAIDTYLTSYEKVKAECQKHDLLVTNLEFKQWKLTENHHLLTTLGHNVTDVTSPEITVETTVGIVGIEAGFRSHLGFVRFLDEKLE